MTNMLLASNLANTCPKLVRLGADLNAYTSLNADLAKLSAIGAGYWSVTYGLDEGSK